MNKTLKLKKIIPLIPFIVLFVTLFIIHFRLGYVNDDLYFRALITENGLNQILNLVHHRYYSWSSRFLIEFVLLFLSYLPIIIWVFLNSLVLVMMAWIIPRFFTKDSNLKNNIISVILVSIFYIPVFEAMSDGAIAISLNYLWPLFFILVHFYLVKYYILQNNDYNKSKNILLYAILVFSLIFACNHEQGLITCFILYVLLIGYCYYSYKKINNPLLILLFLIICCGLIIFLCPGNQLRLIAETNTWWPSFGELSIFNKINMGVSSFYRLFISESILICLLFLLSFGLYVYKISNNKWNALITLFPFIICLIINLLLIFNIIPEWNYFFLSTDSYSLVSNSTSLLFTLFYIIITFCILYGVYNIIKFKNKKNGFSTLLLLIIGFIVSIIIGFTPTMLPSMHRMFIFLYGILLILTYYFLIQIFKQ